MRNLIDFVNHGVLPFAGRQEVGERLFSFWQETRESHEARALLLVGEMGMGKSRVIEELVPQVRRADGVVVHVKLYSDSTIFLAPLIAQALYHSEGGRKLLREEPEKTIPSVLASLRRLARLRPLLLIIEDIHLLDQEAMGDFMLLLNGIADEPVSVLAVARTGTLPSRGVLAPYLVEELRLEGLTRADLEEIWVRFFETSANPDLIDLFLRHTHGNPMALRTALRNALRSGALARNDRSGAWGLSVSVEAFSRQLAEDVHLLSGGMTAHLSPPEKAAAALLATLGENFSRKSGGDLLGEEVRRIDSLIFKGIITSLGLTAQPLCGRRDDLPLLGFTHSLIHHYLLKEDRVNADGLLDVIASGDAICSTIPYRLLRDHAGAVTHPLVHIRAAIDRIVEDVFDLEATADWKSGLLMLDAAQELFRNNESEWSEHERCELDLKLTDARISLSHRENHTAEYGALVERFRKATEDIPEDLAEYRLASFCWSYGQLRRGEGAPGFRRMWDEVEQFIQLHPHLRLTERYVKFLQVAGRTTHVREDVEMLPQIDERFRAFVNDPVVPEEIRNHAMKEVAPLFLWKFSSREELNERLKLLHRLQEIAGESLWFRTRAMAFYEGIGRHREVLALADDLLRALRNRDMRRDLAQVSTIRLAAFGAFGAPAEWIDTELQSIVLEAPGEIQNPLKRMIIRRFGGLTLSLGDSVWTRRIVETYGDEEMLGTADRLLLACCEGRGLEVARELKDNTDLLDGGAAFLLARILGESTEENDAVNRQKFADHLLHPVYIRAQVAERHLVIALLELLGDKELEYAFRNEIRQGLRNMLEWLDEQELPAFALPLLERGASWLTTKEKAAWEERFVALKKEQNLSGLIGEKEEERIEISVIGDISVKMPGEPRTRVRGGRTRMIIGLLAANEILPDSLSYREFCRLASGGEDDPERSRKMSSMGLLRLREAYGDDIVLLKDGESPSLNLDRVRVDLLQVLQLMREAQQEVRHGSLMRAHPALRQGLELLNGEVPFPTLYDDFFEAIRGDLDYLVRETVLDVGRGLIRENDQVVAEQILRLAVRSMPDDEEVADLLHGVLISLGKRTEAERMKMRQDEIEHGW